MKDKVRYLEDPTIAEDILRLGQLDDYMFGVELALKPVVRIRQLYAACGLNPDLLSSDTAFRDIAVRIARRHLGTSSTSTKEAA